MISIAPPTTRIGLALGCALFALAGPGTALQDAAGSGPATPGQSGTNDAETAAEQDDTSSTSRIGIGGGQGLSREEMWYAPTEADWAKPVRITFQRTWEDAVAVSQETGRPILICVNMDGEIASEHYAGIRYRQPEIAATYEPYVCVIASVYRHNARDFDPDGNRILCPRFGSVTCGEHIAIEPILFDRYFEGTRVAPRHIAVELSPVAGGTEQTETYDVYYAFDTESVFQVIEEGVAGREFPPRDPGTDRPLDDLVASRDVRHRQLVERAYREGDAAARRRILRRSAEVGDPPPTDVLRMAVFGLDVELSAMAREILARSSSEDVVGLIAEALRVPMDPAERDALIQALERIGSKSEMARTLAVVHQGLSTRSDDIEADRWTQALATARPETPERAALESRVEYSAFAARTRPDDWKARVDLAEASLGLAVDPSAYFDTTGRNDASRYARLHLEEARRSLAEAERLGAEGWRYEATHALTDYYLGDRRAAYERSEAAVDDLPAGDPSWLGMATLGLFAEARREAIRRSLRAGEEWPKEWIADVHDAYTVLGAHPLGTAEQVVAHYDFLDRFGVAAQATAVLRHGIERFPDAWDLHARLRSRVLLDEGVDALEPTYAELMGREGASENLPWYAGYASLVAGEHHRKNGDMDAADAAYVRALDHYRAHAEAFSDDPESSDFYAAIALAGRARVALSKDELEAAVVRTEESIARSPAAADVLDGLNVSCVGTAKLTRSRAEAAGRTALVQRLDAALAVLDPVQLELPAFEAGGPRPQGARAGGAGQGRDGVPANRGRRQRETEPAPAAGGGNGGGR